MRILIVEDDSLLGDGLQVGLGQAGFTVDWLRDGQEAATVLASPEAHCFAAVVLDLNLPQLSGQEVLARCRAAGNPVPVLVLTARDGVPDKLSALDGGADDYLVKPFDLDEVAARLRALIRRSAGRAAPLLVHGAIRLDPAARRVELAGQPVELSPREFALLEALLAAAGRVRAHGDEAHAQATGPARKEQKDWGIAGDAAQAKRSIEPQLAALLNGSTAKFASDKPPVVAAP